MHHSPTRTLQTTPFMCMKIQTIMKTFLYISIHRNVVQLIIEMENAMKDNANEDNNYIMHQRNKQKLKQNQKYKQRKAFHRSRFHQNIQQNIDSKYEDDDINIDDEKHSIPAIAYPSFSLNKSSNIQRWISRRNKRDLLFMLASISGQTMKIYRKKEPNIEQINCRITMDGKYLMIGSEMIQMDKNLEISLGIDICYADVKYIMNVLGIKCQRKPSKTKKYGDLHVNYSTKHTNTTGSSSDDHYIITKNHYKYGGKSYEIKSRLIRSKHCITIHEPYKRQTIIIQLCNVYDRRMWAQGLCYLKNLTPRARNFRWTVVACFVLFFFYFILFCVLFSFVCFFRFNGKICINIISAYKSECK